MSKSQSVRMSKESDEEPPLFGHCSKVIAWTVSRANEGAGGKGGVDNLANFMLTAGGPINRLLTARSIQGSFVSTSNHYPPSRS